ncbi:hypothetical protein GRF29_103g298979 [Pseudopithomyces chartarum]|uniref:Hpc2-related domain-containing protein n=1 Tax=Pseudopithomyces chartarum TaxID=1892770 RepID=A0AAN6REK7_9PLEO|nr:hypothetical protein GRF29_103g298979 [Pseudopithomyces chartarum]
MEAAENASSPGSLSSPPHSPDQATPNNSAMHVANGGYGVAPSSTPTPAASTTTTPRLTAAGTIRKKPGPKPKPKDPNEPEKKPRKPRKTAEPKDPNAAPAPRKRRTKASLEAQNPLPAPVDEKPALSVLQQPPAPQTRPADLAQVLQPEQPLAVTQPPRVIGSAAEPLHGNPNLSHITPAPSTPRPASSASSHFAAPEPSKRVAFHHVSNRPPSASNTAYAPPARLQQTNSVTSAPLSPAAMSNRQAPPLPVQENPQPPRPAAPLLGPTPMEIDSEPRTSVPMKKTDSASAGTPSNAPTPPVKARQKEAPPPLPTGSGLLSGTPFGPVATTNGNGSTDPTGANIWLTFPLKGRENVTINFAQEVEKKYGFAALHPRIAARRERQRQITSMSAALEKAAGLAGSADDMSVDLSDNDSNGNTGLDEEGSAAGKTKKPRKRKQEDYDKEDDFIDDTELAWEQQALMAKDGFFVYMGPLIPEEKQAVERSDGTIKRGRGRGRGGATRGETSGRGRGRGGGGPGSRGGQTVRKPRVTKADRAQMEQEKAKRIEFSQQLGGGAGGLAVASQAGAVGSL